MLSKSAIGKIITVIAAIGLLYIDGVVFHAWYMSSPEHFRAVQRKAALDQIPLLTHRGKPAPTPENIPSQQSNPAQEIAYVVENSNVIAVDSATMSKKTLGALPNDAKMAYGFSDDLVFFITQNGKLSSLDIDTMKTTEEPLKEVPVRAIFSGDELAYISGNCNMDEPNKACSLHLFYLATGGDKKIIDDLKAPLSTEYGQINIRDLDSVENSIIISESYGGVGLATQTLSKLDLKSLKISKIGDFIERNGCAEAENTCVDSEENINNTEKYEAVINSQLPIFCGDFSYKLSPYSGPYFTLRSNPDKYAALDDARLAGCSHGEVVIPPAEVLADTYNNYPPDWGAIKSIERYRIDQYDESQVYEINFYGNVVAEYQPGVDLYYFAKQTGTDSCGSYREKYRDKKDYIGLLYDIDDSEACHTYSRGIYNINTKKITAVPNDLYYATDLYTSADLYNYVANGTTAATRYIFSPDGKVAFTSLPAYEGSLSALVRISDGKDLDEFSGSPTINYSDNFRMVLVRSPYGGMASPSSVFHIVDTANSKIYELMDKLIKGDIDEENFLGDGPDFTVDFVINKFNNNVLDFTVTRDTDFYSKGSFEYNLATDKVTKLN